MKKQTITTILFGLIVTGLLLLSACRNVLAPSVSGAEQGKGTVTVSFSAAGKAALTPGETAFDMYEFTFTRQGDGQPFTFYPRQGDSFTFSLSKESYKLTVKAYTGVDWNNKNLAAQGVTDTFTVGNSTQVTVKLTGVINEEVKGQFTFNIQYPAGAVLDQLVLLSDADNSINLTEDQYSDVTSGTDTAGLSSKGDGVTVPSGWYFVIVRLSMDGKTAGYANGVQILPGANTPFVREFSEADFKEPSASANVGKPVDNWHGFVVSGEGFLESNDASPGLATGISYETYQDETGTYSDVLQLNPPAGGYKPGATVMIYQVPYTGTYKLSMDIWVDKYPQDGDVYIDWAKTPDWATIAGNRTQAADVTDSEGQLRWLHVSTDQNPEGGAEVNEGEIICLLANLSNMPGGHTGLDDATIYIKNLSLEVDTGSGTIVLIGPGADETFRILPPTITLYSKGTRQLTVSGNTTGDVTWSSSNPLVTVTQTGFISAGMVTKDESATITAGTGEKTATAQVTVHPKYIAITFDDGPDGSNPSATPLLLDELKAKGVHTTFFSVGGRVAVFPELTQEAFANGNDIGNHSYNHTFAYFNEGDSSYYEHSKAEYKKELMDTQDEIASVIDHAPIFFRSPNLNSSNNLVAAAAELGLPLIFAQSLEDWNPGTLPDYILNRVTEEAKPWGILLFHDYFGGPPTSDGWVGNGVNTVSAIPDVIDWLRNDGYEVLSVSEMLDKKKALYLTPGTIYNDFSGVQADPAFPANGVINPVTSFTVSDTSITLDAGQTRTITGTINTDATRKRVYWYSADTSIATVSAAFTESVTGNVTVTARAAGETTIMARASNGLTQKITVTVNSGTVVPPDGNEGTLLGYYDSWNGFLIRGPAGMEAAPVATHYDAYKDDSSGTPYTDVLKLEPPAGGYGKGTMALAYQIPEDGTYKISMWVKVVKKNPEDPVYLCWEHTDADWEALAGSYYDAAPVTDGVWYHLDTTATHPEGIHFNQNAVIALLTQNNLNEPLEVWDKVGLNDATIYIRDVEWDVVKEGIETATSWDVFDIPGATNGDKASGADGVVVDFDGYSNVLKLTLPTYDVLSGYQFVTNEPAFLAMIYELPRTGVYRLSMEAYVVKGNDPVTISWEMNQDPWKIAGDWNPVSSYGEWLPIGGGESDWFTIGENDLRSIFLIAWHRNHYGLADSTVYFRDLKLEWASAPGAAIETIIDIPSTIAPLTPPVSQGVTLDWADGPVPIQAVVNGTVISQDPSNWEMTIGRGGTVTLTAQGDFSSYEWTLNRDVVGAQKTYVFNGTEPGTYKILLKVNGTQQGGTITITVE